MDKLEFYQVSSSFGQTKLFTNCLPEVPQIWVEKVSGCFFAIEILKSNDGFSKKGDVPQRLESRSLSCDGNVPTFQEITSKLSSSASSSFSSSSSSSSSSSIVIIILLPFPPFEFKVYDDVWGSSERAPSYTALRRQAASCDWLLRSLELLPGGSVVIRRSLG